MSRLIDADELLKNYGLDKATKYGNKDIKQLEHSYSTLMLYEIADMIKDAPTVYDVDKVVELLEEKADEANDSISTEFHHPQYHDGREEGFREAIEIVKAGGKSETT